MSVCFALCIFYYEQLLTIGLECCTAPEVLRPPSCSVREPRSLRERVDGRRLHKEKPTTEFFVRSSVAADRPPLQHDLSLTMEARSALSPSLDGKRSV